MKTRLGLLLCTAVSLGCAQSDLTGKWQVSATPEGRKEMKFDADLKHTGGDLTGTVNSPLGAGPVQNARVGNPDVSFQFLINKYLFDVKAVVVDGNEMRGTFSGPRNMQGVFIAKRNGVAPIAQPVEGTEVGEANGAAFRIDIPANYNGTLVVYCHGYSPTPGKFTKDAKAAVKIFTEQGFAVAQSGYSKGGWAVKEAVEETERLRQYFVGKYGKPKRTFVTGHSMGGVVTIATLEKYPEAYDGAMPMCGPLASSLSTLKERLFDTLVVFDYYFPGVIGSPVKISEKLVGDPFSFAAELKKAVDGDGDKKSAILKYTGLATDNDLIQVVAFFAVIQAEMIARAGGNPFDNRDTLYSGTLDDVAVNRGVQRYAADPQAAAYLRKYVTMLGQPKKPVLSLHTTYDPLVPAWSANAYGQMVKQNGLEQMYVQRFVARNGHCSFQPSETANAFRDLVKWQETGQRPASGEQQ